MSVLPTINYTFNGIPIKILESYFVDINKLILQSVGRGKRPERTSSIFKDKNKVRKQTLPHFKTLKLQQSGQYGIDRRIEKSTNRIESSKMDSHK